MKPETFVVQSPFRGVLVPKVDLWTLLKQAFKAHGKNTATIVSDPGHQTTYSDLLLASHHVAAHFLSHGFDSSRPVLLFMRTSLEFVLVCLAVWRLGGHLVCVNPLLTSNDLLSVLEMISRDIIVCEESHSNITEEAITRLGVKKTVILKSHLSISRFPMNHEPPFQCTHCPRCAAHVAPSPMDTALILLSSGTTGKPKAVQISHRALVGQTLMWSSPELGNVPQKTAILYQPFSHIYGFSLMVIHLYMGVPCVLMEAFSLQKFITHILHYKPDQLHIVPPIAVMLCKSETLRHEDLSFVKSVTSAAAPLGRDLSTQLTQLFSPTVTIRQLYGLTEVAGRCLGVPFSYYHKSQPCPAGSIGWPFPNVTAKVISSSDGSNVGPNQTGELCVKSDFFMTGYIGNPEATRRTIDEKGWLHTGDLAYYDESNCFFIVDRLKEVIKVKGYQVAPAELESILLSHREVLDVGVVGVPHSTWGEVPLAWIVRKTGSKVTEGVLVEYVNKKVASFKQLSGGVIFVEEVPKSASGKILRREMKRIMSEQKLTSKL